MQKALTDTSRYELLQHADDIVAVYAPCGQRKFVNDAFCRLFQRQGDDLVGKRYMDLPVSMSAGLAGNLFVSLTKENPAITLTMKSGVEGAEKWVSWKGSGIFADCGALTEVLLIGRIINDVAELNRIKDLATLNAFRKAIDKNIICSISDTKGYITYANEKFCQVSGYSELELVGKTHRIVNSGFHTTEFFDRIKETISAGNMWKGQIKNKAKDASFYWVESVIVPIKNGDGAISGYLSLHTLLTEEKKLEEERNAYLKSLEDMLFMVSHEIRKPIVSCQGLLHLMEGQMPATQKEYDEIVGHLVESAREMDEYSRKLNEYLQKNMKIARI